MTLTAGLIEHVLVSYFAPPTPSVPGATDSVIQRLERGEVASVTCPRCEGRRMVRAARENAKLRPCNRCRGRGCLVLAGKATAIISTASTQVHDECKGAGCQTCRWRGYVDGLAAQPMSSGCYSAEPPDARVDVVMAVSRWLRRQSYATRRALEAWYAPEAVQWRQGLAAGRECAGKPWPSDLRASLDLAPLLPLTRYGRAAHQATADGLAWADELQELALVEAVALRSNVVRAVEGLAPLLAVGPR